MITKPEGSRLLFHIMSDDGQPLLLTKEQIEYVHMVNFMRSKKREAVEQQRHDKLMRQTKRRQHFNPRLN
jgi:hypothetical protein